jgi:hypothetical protein
MHRGHAMALLLGLQSRDAIGFMRVHETAFVRGKRRDFVRLGWLGLALNSSRCGASTAFARLFSSRERDCQGGSPNPTFPG